MKKDMRSGISVEVYTYILCLAFSLTSAHDLAVTAIQDQVAFIPCHAFTSAKKIPGTVTLIKWIRSSFYKPIYTLDLRPLNSSLSVETSFVHRGRHFPSPESEGRLYIDLSLDPIVLRIDPVKQEDAGLYTCKLEFKNWRSVHSALDLEVIIPPKEAIIRDSKGEKLENVVGPFYLGETLQLTCESIGGRPTPTALWSSDAEDIGQRDINGSLLTIEFLQRSDQWSRFTCTVRNTNMTAPKSVTVTIELILPPLELHLQSNINQSYVVGESIHISCTCFGSYPKAHIKWRKDGELMQAEERISEKGNVTTSFVEFIAQPSDNRNEIECFAANPDMKNHILRRHFMLTVYYKPKVNIGMLSNQSQLSEGNILILLCSVRANPQAYKTVWLFENEVIVNRSSFVLQGQKLLIQNLTRSHSGLYVCTATNEYGEDRASARIEIKHKPVCQEMEKSYTYGPEIDEVNVTCNLASYPSDVTFYWTLRNSTSNHSWSTGQVPHTRIEWQKSNLELLCWGRNEIGAQRSPCKFLLVGDKMHEIRKFADVSETKKSALYLPIILITSFVVIIVCIAVFIVIRKYKMKYDSASVSSSHNEMVHLKDMDLTNSMIDILLLMYMHISLCCYIIVKTHYYDNTCGRLISKCVKQSAISSESDCSANLLTPLKKHASQLYPEKTDLD